MHTVKLWSAVSINNVEYNSDVITYEVPWVDTSNPTPIIWVESELGTVVNYEEAVVKYMVYSAEAERQGAPVEVSLYRGTDLLNTEEVYYDSISWHTMDLTSNYTVGNNVFTLTCGFTTKEIKFYVTTENARDLSLRYEDQLESILLNGQPNYFYMDHLLTYSDIFFDNYIKITNNLHMI